MSGVHPGDVGEAAGHADRALRQAVGEESAHRGELVRSGRAIVVTDRQHPQRTLRDQVRGVDRAAPVDAVEVAADGTPVPVEPVRIAVPAGELPAQYGERRVVHRRVAQTVLAENLQRHALRGLRQMFGIGEHREVGVGVHVDEAGREHQPGGVDDPTGGRWPRPRADRRDPAAGNRDVGADPRCAGAVDHVAAPEQHRLAAAIRATR